MDIHYFEYGQVLGHEGVGIVIDIGKNVPQDLFSRGDVIGFGIQLNVCSLFNLLTYLE
jgi:D-arabinose 1-dehydrogenase-like Zn-dependent alcohol dehydrogenase